MKITSWAEVQLDKRELRNLMRSAANDVKSKTARLLNKTGGSGRVYRGGGGARYRGAYKPGHYQASAPGEPPVRVTGSLRSSLRARVYQDGNGFSVRERAFYALFLEAGAQGGRPGSRGAARVRRRRAGSSSSSPRVLEPRPSLDRVMAEQERQLEGRVQKAFETGAKWRDTK